MEYSAADDKVSYTFNIPDGGVTYEFSTRSQNSAGWSDYAYQYLNTDAFAARRALSSDGKYRKRSLRGSTAAS
jgi:hypothetical protein